MRENGFQTKWAIPTDIYWRCHIDVKRVPTEDSTLDRALDSAISASWKELAQGSPIEAMQVEYRTGASGSLDYLKLWSSTLRGHWNLVCEYWIQANGTHSRGITFLKPYSSASLARTLDVIMRNQERFCPASMELLDGLVQVAPPDEIQAAAASNHIAQILERITSKNSPGTVTAAMRTATGHLA